MTSGIYQIVNTQTGKVYIGSSATVPERWRQHRHLLRRGLHHSVKLQRSWAKHGEEAFVFSVLECAPTERLIQREQAWIDSLRPFYNVAPLAGTRRGVKLSAETRQKMSAARVGKSPSPETRAKMSAWQLGRKRSAETCRKVSESKKAAGLKGRPAFNKGVPHSEETRAKMRAAHARRRELAV